MKHIITKLKKNIKKRINDISFDDFLEISKHKSHILRDKLKNNLNKWGIDKYAYKAQKYFNKAQDKIEKSFKNI